MEDRSVTIAAPLDFVEGVISEFNTWITAQPAIAPNDEFAPLDVVLARADEFAEQYGKRKHNANLRFVVLGVLLCLIFESTLPDDGESDTDDPLMSKSKVWQ